MGEVKKVLLHNWDMTRKHFLFFSPSFYAGSDGSVTSPDKPVVVGSSPITLPKLMERVAQLDRAPFIVTFNFLQQFFVGSDKSVTSFGDADRRFESCQSSLLSWSRGKTAGDFSQVTFSFPPTVVLVAG